MNPAFVYNTNGLEVSFRILNKVPAKATFSWDFGDDTDSSELRIPVHTYETPGFYTVTLEITEEEETNSVSQLVMVTDKVKTHLTDTIYNLIDNYIPQESFAPMTIEQKMQFISKWQLYLGPLVNHEILPEDYQDELAYEGLENQLVMELAAYDFLMVRVENLLKRTGDYFEDYIGKVNTQGDSDTEEGGGKVKHITTGPTEVEFFGDETISGWWRYYIQALQPGGILDQMKANLCTLAQRLRIFLPFCPKVNKPVAPKVGLRRPSTSFMDSTISPISGPDPSIVITK